MYKEDLALNYPKWLIKPNLTKSYIINIYVLRGFGIK